MSNVRIFTDALGSTSDSEIPIRDRNSLVLNINQDKDFYYLHVFLNNNYLFSIQAKERIQIDDYLFVNNLKFTNDFVKRIYNN